jgi:hypothetical protein
MSAMMSAPPPPPMSPPPSGPPPAGNGHGPFSEEDIQQIMADTGYSYQQVCQAIDQTGAQTKEDLFPQFYSGQGIQPQAPGQETVSPGAVQGAAPSPGAMPPTAPPEATEGEPVQSAPTEMAEGEGIDPKVALAMHAAMAPKSRYRRSK